MLMPRDALVGLRPRDVLAPEQHLAGRWRVGADDQLEQRALARAVGSDQAVDLALLDLEVTSETAERPPKCLLSARVSRYAPSWRRAVLPRRRPAEAPAARCR